MIANESENGRAPLVTLGFVLAHVLWEQRLVLGLLLRRASLLTLPTCDAPLMVLDSFVKQPTEFLS